MAQRQCLASHPMLQTFDQRKLCNPDILGNLSEARGVEFNIFVGNALHLKIVLELLGEIGAEHPVNRVIPVLYGLGVAFHFRLLKSPCRLGSGRSLEQRGVLPAIYDNVLTDDEPCELTA